MSKRITKWISLIERCGLQYRSDVFNEISLCGNHHMYIFCIAHNNGISQEELAKKIHVNKSNVTRNIQVLEEKGLVKRISDENDKRAFKLYLTEEGNSLIPKIIEKQQFWNDIILESISEEEIDQMIELLKKIAMNACNYTNKLYTEED